MAKKILNLHWGKEDTNFTRYAKEKMGIEF